MRQTAIILGVVSAMVLFAVPEVANADETLVIDQDRRVCNVFDGNGRFTVGIGARITVLTDSATGREMFQCHVSVANDSGQAVNYDALNNPLGRLVRCGFRDENGEVTITESWHETVSENGDTIFTCDFREEATPAVSIGANCVMFDGDGFLVASDEASIRLTPSDTDYIECTATSLANGTGSAINYNADNNPIGTGVRCALTVDMTTRTTLDWNETITPGGRGRIRCRFNDLQTH